MKLNWKDFLRKCQFPVLLACAVLPVAVIVLSAFAPGLLDSLWMFPAAYVLLAFICLVLPGKARLIAGVPGSAGLIALGVYLLPGAEHFLFMLIPVMYAALLLQGLKMGGWSRDTELYIAWYAVGVVCHIAGQLMVNVANRTGNFPVYQAAAPALMVSFILFATLALLSLNRSTMHGASMGRQRVPMLMRRRNVILTLCLLALALFIAALPEVVRALETAWQWLLQAIIAIATWLSRLLPKSSSSGGGGGAMDMSALGGEASEPGLFAVIMEKVALVIAVIALVVLAIFILRKLYQKLRVLIRYLAERLSLFAQTSSEDFEDEITDTREEGEQERISVLDSLRRRLVRVDEKKLSPTQRVRYRYLRLMVKHPEWHASQTARESIPEDAAALYERARYSGESVSPEEAERFAGRTRSL